MGSAPIVVTEIRHVDIHDSHYLDVAYVIDGDASGATHVCRIGSEAVEGEARPGTRWVAEFAMRQIIRLRPGRDPAR